MAKVEAERRDLLKNVKKDATLTEWRQNFSMHGEDVHYTLEMVSGCKLLEKCVDCVTELQNIRDEGDGGLIVNVNGDILSPVHAEDAVEVVCWLVKQGNRSRLYGFEMYKTAEFNVDKDRSIVFEEPILAVKGNVTFVISKSDC